MMNVVKRSVMCLVVAALTAVLMTRAGAAQSAPAAKRQDTVATGGSDCGDKNTKVTKEQWMELMAAEFDRLDKNKTGQIELAEPTKSSNRPFSFYGR